MSRSQISQIVCLTGITLALDFLFLSNFSVIQAKPAKNHRTSHQGLSSNRRSKPAKNHRTSHQGLPSNRRDGGSRGNCIANNANNKDFIAIVPEQGVSVTASSPTQIFFYVPPTEVPKIIEFIL